MNFLKNLGTSLMTKGGSTGLKNFGATGVKSAKNLKTKYGPMELDLSQQMTHQEVRKTKNIDFAMDSLMSSDGEGFGYGAAVYEVNSALMTQQAIQGRAQGRQLQEDSGSLYVGGSGNDLQDIEKRVQTYQPPQGDHFSAFKESGTWPDNVSRLLDTIPRPQDQETAFGMGMMQGIVDNGGNASVSGFSQGTASIRNAQYHVPDIFDGDVNTHGKSASVGGQGKDFQGRLDPVPLTGGVLNAFMPLSKSSQSQRDKVSTGMHGHSGDTYMAKIMAEKNKTL